MSMKWLFENYPNELRCSFAFPAIGHFITHSSDILDRDRKAEWDSWYVSEGDQPVQLWTWTRDDHGKSKTHALLDFNFSGVEEGCDWLTFYRESDTPQVQPAATSKAMPKKKIGVEKRPWRWRDQEEMRHAFDVDRMVGSHQPTTHRQRRQKRRYVVDSAKRIYTAVLHEAV